MSIGIGIEVTTDKLTFAEVNEVNATFRTFEERRLKLIELLYGKNVRWSPTTRGRNRWIPTRWLNDESLIAAQSLVDTHVAKFERSPDRSGECIRPRNWLLPRPISIEKLAAQ